MKYKIPIMVPSYGEEEIDEAIASLRSRKVTMGEKVKAFEEGWANYIGTKYAVMVNSGSSANLLGHLLLSNPLIPKHISAGEEVITPAVTWPTTVFPIINIGAIPVLVDVDLETLDMKTDQLDDALSEKTRAITFVHLLGNPCEMKELLAFAREHDLLLVEDACNAHGAEYEGRKCGSFGNVSTFSFYFSHIISTIEGGMLNTDNEEYYERARAMRSFGWTRGTKLESSISKEYGFIDKRFMFAYLGFNFRPTEIQGAFGIHQIRRLDEFIRIRQENAKYWLEALRKLEKYFILPRITRGGTHVWHHFPLTVRPGAPFSREKIVGFLENKGVETRPISAGNIAEQPVMRSMNARKIGKLPNAQIVMRNSFEWGNHQGIDEEERSYVIESIKEFVHGYSSLGA